MDQRVGHILWYTAGTCFRGHVCLDVCLFKARVCVGAAHNSGSFHSYSVQDGIAECVQSDDPAPQALQDAESVRGDLIMFIRLLIKARKWAETI